MKLFDYINILTHRVVRKKLFRNEAELSIYSGKSFKLPPIAVLKDNSLTVFRKNYPFRLYDQENELRILRNEIKVLEEVSKITESAEKIINNVFPANDYEDLTHNEKIRWNYDHITGYSWDNEIVWKKDFYETPKGVDINRVWELGRLSQLIFLGKAYLVEPEEKYVSKFLSLIDDFNTSNSFCRGVNWVNSTEVSIRLLNISFALGFFIHSDLIQSYQLNKILEILLLHTVFIENNLEYFAKRDSGYLISTLALGAAGLIFRDSGYGTKILQSSFKNFERDIRIQINQDGTNYEQSVPNHSIILEAFYIAKIIFEKGAFQFSGQFNALLHKMFNVQAAYLRDDHSVPQIGEGNMGRLIKFNLSDLKRDNSYPLPIGAYLFRDEELKQINRKGSVELLFLFGAGAIDNYKKISNLNISAEISSAEFPVGKHFILRSEDLHMFVEAGETGIAGQTIRGHNDVFSFDLYYKKRNFIVDPGSYSFYADKDLNRRMRSIKYHNTIYIDDENLTTFNDKQDSAVDHTSPKITEWHPGYPEEILTAEHYAYTRLTDPVVCRRTFVYQRDKKLIKIKDELLGGDKHKANLNLYLHPSVKIIRQGEKEFILDNAGIKIRIRLHGSSTTFVVTEGDAYYSDYGKIIPTAKIGAALTDKFPAFILTEIELL